MPEAHGLCSTRETRRYPALQPSIVHGAECFDDEPNRARGIRVKRHAMPSTLQFEDGFDGDDSFLAGGGIIGELLRSIDWSTRSLVHAAHPEARRCSTSAASKPGGCARRFGPPRSVRSRPVR